ncbi:MAG: T9SS type A sorting domain-containing protein [Tannerellaceae bacterium]|jgi:hypothetical protein|nr:T9SS type A sorting domain-containing protein [Tannerellaceae bacterium]
MERLVKWLLVPMGIFLVTVTSAQMSVPLAYYQPVNGEDPALYFGNDYRPLFLGGDVARTETILNTADRLQGVYHKCNLGLTGWDFDGDSICAEAPFIVEPVTDEEGRLAYYHIKGKMRVNDSPSAAAFRFAASPTKQLDFSKILSDKKNYFLHLALRLHKTEDFFVILSDGQNYWLVPVQDFPADGTWHYVDIALEELPSDFFSASVMDTAALIGIAGGYTDQFYKGDNANLDIDWGAAFFYRKMKRFELSKTTYGDDISVWDSRKEEPLNAVLQSFYPTGTPEGTWWASTAGNESERLLIPQLEWVSSDPSKVSIDKEKATMVFHPFSAGTTEIFIRTGFAGVEDTCKVTVTGLSAHLKDEAGRDMKFPLIGLLDTFKVQLEYPKGVPGEKVWQFVSVSEGLEALSVAPDGWVTVKGRMLGTHEIIGKVSIGGKDSTIHYPVYVVKTTYPSAMAVAEQQTIQLPVPDIEPDLSEDVVGYLSESYWQDVKNWKWTMPVTGSLCANVSSDGKLSGNIEGMGGRITGVRASLEGTTLVTLPLAFYVVEVNGLTPFSDKVYPVAGKKGENPAFTMHYTAYEDEPFSIRWSCADDSIEVDPVTGEITITGATLGKIPVVACLDGNEALRAEGYIRYWPYADSIVITSSPVANITLGVGDASQYTPTAKVWPEYGVDTELWWESLDENIVLANAKTGTVTGLRCGTGRVRVVAEAHGENGEERADTFSVEVSLPFGAALFVERAEDGTEVDTVRAEKGVSMRFRMGVFAELFTPFPQEAVWAISSPERAKLEVTDEGCTVTGVETFAGTDTLTLSVSLEGLVKRCVLILTSPVPPTSVSPVSGPDGAFSVACINGVLYLCGAEGYRHEVFSLTGRCVAAFATKEQESVQSLFLQEGIYLLRSFRDKKQAVSKFRIKR